SLVEKKRDFFSLATDHWPLATDLPVAVHHRLVLVLEVFDGHSRVHIEDGLADGMPLTAMEKENGRSIAKSTHGGKTLHVTTLDGFKLDGDAGQGGQLASAAFASKGKWAIPITILPT